MLIYIEANFIKEISKAIGEESTYNVLEDLFRCSNEEEMKAAVSKPLEVSIYEAET